MTIVNPPRPTVLTLSGATKQLDNPFAVVRVEDDEDGTPIRLYDRNGHQLQMPSELEPKQLKKDMSAPLVGRPSSSTNRDWAESVIAHPAKNNERRAALGRRFGPSTGRVRTLDRFLSTENDATIEMLADPVSGLLVETNVARNGSLFSHTTIRYEPRADGSLVKRSLHTEQIVGTNNGERAVIDVEFSDVKLTASR